MAYKPEEFEKFKDEHVRAREVEDGIGRFRMGLFVAALGPAALVALNYSGFLPLTSKALALAIYATAPAGLLLGFVNFLRLPGEAKFSRMALSIGFLTLAAAAGTFILARKFSVLGS
jgi:hypothetical protein